MSFVKFHQRAIAELPEEFYSAEPNLSNFYSGSDTFASEELMTNAEDCIRFMVEDCGHLGEFQIMVDAASALGGFACKVIQDLIEDEYPKAFIRTWASFANCQDFEFSKRPPNALIAASLSFLSKVSTQIIPILLSSPASKHHMLVDEQHDFDKALHASAVVAAAFDVVATNTLSGNISYSERKLAELKIATPVHELAKDQLFTSLAIGKQEAVQNWEKMNPICRMNYSEDQSGAQKPSDLPIYAPNFMYTGYQQQASTGVVILDSHAQHLSSHIHTALLKNLSLSNFRGNVAGHDADEVYTEVRETLYNLVDLDE